MQETMKIPLFVHWLHFKWKFGRLVRDIGSEERSHGSIYKSNRVAKNQPRTFMSRDLRGFHESERMRGVNVEINGTKGSLSRAIFMNT